MLKWLEILRAYDCVDNFLLQYVHGSVSKTKR